MKRILFGINYNSQQVFELSFRTPEADGGENTWRIDHSFQGWHVRYLLLELVTHRDALLGEQPADLCLIENQNLTTRAAEGREL